MSESRARLCQIEAGQGSDCCACGQPIKFQASVTRSLRQKVVCNVYEDGKWSRVEQYHLAPVNCYEEAGKPYGEVL